MEKFGISGVGWHIYMDILVQCGGIEVLQCVFDL